MPRPEKNFYILHSRFMDSLLITKQNFTTSIIFYIMKVLLEIYLEFPELII
jgi:hypothetical protein